MNDLLAKYQEYKAMNINIDMTRGKPCPEQLNLSLPMLDIVNSKTNCFDEDIDCRNYSALEGIPECKKLFSDILDVPVENILVCGASSMNIMHNLLLNPNTTVITIGELSKNISDEIKNCNSVHFSDIPSAIEFIKNNISNNSKIFLKASRSMKFERVIEGLK